MEEQNVTRVDKSKALDFCPDRTFTVVVGVEPRQKKFLVHEEIICKRSEFFKRAMNPNWMAAVKGVIKLLEDDPAIFALYVNLIYTKTVPTATADLVASKSSDKIYAELQILSSLYVLCEKLQDIDAKESMIKMIETAVKDFVKDGKWYVPDPAAVRIMYNGTPENSPGRRLYADFWTRVGADEAAKTLGDLPKEFVTDLALALLRKQPQTKATASSTIATATRAGRRYNFA